MTVTPFSNYEATGILSDANLDSLLKKRATVFEFLPDFDTIFHFDSSYIRGQMATLVVKRTYQDSAESILKKMRVIENKYMAPLMGCRERLVRSCGWASDIEPAFKNRQFYCLVTSIGIDSLIQPMISTEHLPEYLECLKD